MTSTAMPPAETSEVLARLGGWRGVVDGAVPPMVFVTVYAIGGLVGVGDHTLHVGAGAALATAAAMGVVRVRGGHTVAGALRGLVALVLALGVALSTGRARDFFLPGIYVDALWCIGLTVSVVLGRPAVGYAYAVLFRSARGWRTHPPLRRVLAIATVGWAAVYAVRATIQIWLYQADQPELLGLAKTALGWPITALAVVWTLRAARRSTRAEHCLPA